MRPESDEYDLFCELHPCPECDGIGIIPDDGYGEKTCPNCNGSGVDPDAEAILDDLS